MSRFLEDIFARLKQAAEGPVLMEVSPEGGTTASGRELLDQIRCARAHVRMAGVHAGDRCALLGPNSIRWVAMDLALMAEGIVVVPLYARQAPGELAAMVKDAAPRLLICNDVQ